MPFVAYDLHDAEADRVMLVPCDPRDGPVAATPVGAGTAMQAALVLLSRCSLEELHWLDMTGLRALKRKVAGEERAAEQLRRETTRTGVVPAASIQREFDQAVVEEEEFGDGIWREDVGESTPRGPTGKDGV